MRAPELPEAIGGATIVVKLGGSVGRDDTLPEDTRLLQAAGAQVVLVHGGGPLITTWLDRIGKETRFIEGLRYTDEETLEIVRMVLAGLVNGDLVARLGAAGVRAVGLSGADDQLLVARPRTPTLGLVGDVCAVNPRALQLLLEAGYAVVVAPVAVDEGGRFLNVNADTVAAEVALAVGASHLVFLTDVDGVSDGSGRLRQLTAHHAQALVAQGIVGAGMIPKVQACVRFAAQDRRAVIVDGREPHAVLHTLVDPGLIGTVVLAENEHEG